MRKPNAERVGRIRRFLESFPQLHDDVFQFMEPELRALALEDPAHLSNTEAVRLIDRIRYLSKHRLPEPRPPRPRCQGKAIYDEQGARAVAKIVWNAGRGEMRLYACPLCQGYHLTHTEQLSG